MTDCGEGVGIGAGHTRLDALDGGALGLAHDFVDLAEALGFAAQKEGAGEVAAVAGELGAPVDDDGFGGSEGAVGEVGVRHGAALAPGHDRLEGEATSAVHLDGGVEGGSEATFGDPGLDRSADVEEGALGDGDRFFEEGKLLGVLAGAKALDDGRGGDEVGAVGLGHALDRLAQREEVAVAEVGAGEPEALPGKAGGGKELGEPGGLGALRIEDGEAPGAGLAAGLGAVARIDGEDRLRGRDGGVAGRAGEPGQVAAVRGVAMVDVIDRAGDVEAVESGFVEGDADARESLGGERGGGHEVSVALDDRGG